MSSRYAPPAEIIQWKDLSLTEQQAFLRMGYKPSEGTIIHGNLDIEHADTRTMGDSESLGDSPQAHE